MNRIPLLTESIWPELLKHVHQFHVDRVASSTNLPSLRQAACKLARYVMKECDEIDPRSLRAIEAAEAFGQGAISLEQLVSFREDAEDAAFEAIHREDEARTEPETLDERVLMLKTQAAARATTCAVACTLRSELAAVAHVLSEAGAALGIRTIIQDEEAIADALSEVS